MLVVDELRSAGSDRSVIVATRAEAVATPSPIKLALNLRLQNPPRIICEAL